MGCVAGLLYLNLDQILLTPRKPAKLYSLAKWGGRNERHPVNGATREPSEQIKCASRSAMRERRSGFDIAN